MTWIQWPLAAGLAGLTVTCAFAAENGSTRGVLAANSKELFYRDLSGR